MRSNLATLKFSTNKIENITFAFSIEQKNINMYTTEIEINPYQLKLELIRYIDNLNESRLMQLYKHLIRPADKNQDFWLSLTE